jgi:proline dehydrogenase
VFGTQWWLYVCNRLAEDPQRLLQAVVDAAS